MAGRVNVPNRVRAACARVAARARSVTVLSAGIESCCRGLAVCSEIAPEKSPAGDREQRGAFVICLDAINFGSGWWPTIRKRPGHSGYGTIAAALGEHADRHGAWTAAELAGLSAGEVAAVLGQDPGHPLMAKFATALRDVGERVAGEHDGSFAVLVEAAEGSAATLAGTLASWDSFADVSSYEGEPVPFYKRAQIAAADLDRVGAASFADLDRLTAFADNLVPHVLRLDGVLRLDPALAAAIDRGELLVHGSPEEVELRACAVHAVELLAAASGRSPAEIDGILWRRGGGARYKETPRPRSRNTAY